MIIKDFAKLCGCNPQTLRYYDSIDLLKPVKVDIYTGYRHYAPEQALQFLKIKKLQDAMFSIDEIKKLIDCNEDEIYKALSDKIIEQKEILEEIRKTQRSYRKEIKEMREKVDLIKENLMTFSTEIDYVKEFGLTKDEYLEIINGANDLIDDCFTEGNLEINYDDKGYNYEDFDLIFKINGFKSLKEVIKKLPKLDDGEYIFEFETEAEESKNVIYSIVFAELILNRCVDETENSINIRVKMKSDQNCIKVYKKVS